MRFSVCHDVSPMRTLPARHRKQHTQHSFLGVFPVTRILCKHAGQGLCVTDAMHLYVNLHRNAASDQVISLLT